MFRVIPLVKFLVVLGVDIDVHQKNPSAFVRHVSVPSVTLRLDRCAALCVDPLSPCNPGAIRPVLLCIGRLSHASLLHTTRGVCRTPPRRHSMYGLTYRPYDP